jgi:hypothetical protein
MTDNLEADFRQVQTTDTATRFLAGSNIEVIGDFLPGEAPDILEALCSRFVMELTGKQTIYQTVPDHGEATRLIEWLWKT